MKKSLILALILALSVAFVAPVAYAKEVEGVSIVEKEKIDRAIAELDLVKDEAEAAGQDEIVKKIDQLRFNPETIYDLDSIGSRIELLVKVIEIIRFSTTELSTKVSAAHTKVAGLVGIGLVKIFNPFESAGSLEGYIDKLEGSKDELINYPNLGPDDIATIYVLNSLDEILHKGRFLPLDKGPEGVYYKSKEVKDKLRKEIHEITLKRLQPQITVMQAQDLMAAAELAIEEAVASPDVRASREEIKKLVKELQEARAFSGKELDRGAAKIRFDLLIAEITFKVRLKINVTSAEVQDAIKVIDLARREAANGVILGDLAEMLQKI